MRPDIGEVFLDTVPNSSAIDEIAYINRKYKDALELGDLSILLPPLNSSNVEECIGAKKMLTGKCQTKNNHSGKN